MARGLRSNKKEASLKVLQVSILCGKVPHIIAQGAEFINPCHFVEVYNLSQ
jgi:hypothetical protein